MAAKTVLQLPHLVFNLQTTHAPKVQLNRGKDTANEISQFQNACLSPVACVVALSVLEPSDYGKHGKPPSPHSEFCALGLQRLQW